MLITFTSFFTALALGCGIGIGPWDALSKSISEVTNIQIGSVGLILNFSCIMFQFILKKGKITTKLLLQIPLCIFLGMYTNFFFYEIFYNVSGMNYSTRLVLLIVCYICLAFSVATISELDIVPFALEGLCREIQCITTYNYGFIRQLIDLVCISFCLIIFIIKPEILNIREGSLIALTIFGPLLTFFSKLLK